MQHALACPKLHFFFSDCAILFWSIEFKITVVLEQVGAVFLIAMPLLDLQCHRTL